MINDGSVTMFIPLQILREAIPFIALTKNRSHEDVDRLSALFLLDFVL